MNKRDSVIKIEDKELRHSLSWTLSAIGFMYADMHKYHLIAAFLLLNLIIIPLASFSEAILSDIKKNKEKKT